MKKIWKKKDWSNQRKIKRKIIKKIKLYIKYRMNMIKISKKKEKDN